MTQTLRNYTNSSEREANIRDLQERGLRMLHDHTFTREDIVVELDKDGEEVERFVIVFDHGELTFTDTQPERIDSPDWIEQYRAARGGEEKADVIARRSGWIA